MALGTLHFSISPASIGMLGYLRNRIYSTRMNSVELDVGFLRPYCIAFLDQIVFDCKKKIYTTTPKVNQYLKQVNFKNLDKNCECDEHFSDDVIIKIKRFKGKPLSLENKVVDWVEEEVIKYIKGISNKLKKDIVENLWEIVNNGIIHGKCYLGVSVCGQLYPQMGYFELAFYDLGFGIPDLVRGFNKKLSKFDDIQCVEWAMKKGNSTLPIGKASGLGLFVFKRFIKLNGGEFQLISGNACYQQTKKSFAELRNSIPGTLVNIRVIYDHELFENSPKIKEIYERNKYS